MSQSQDLEFVYAEIKHHLDNVLADETITTIIQMLKEYPDLKEKLKFYLEPFELRPTYQELEKKLERVETLRLWIERDINAAKINKDQMAENMATCYNSKLKSILEGKE